MDPLKERLQFVHGGRILDVATGHGQFLRMLVRAFDDIIEPIGIDTSEENIRIARRECGDGFHLEIMDGEKIAFPDDHFDTVSIRHSLHHLANIEAVLAEMKRVLRPGGLFIVCEVFQSPETERENSERHLHHWWAAVDRVEGRIHNETLTRAEVLRYVDQLGLVETDVFEHIDEYGDDRREMILTHMMNRTRGIIERLRENGGSTELIRRGEKLVATFDRLGYVDETSLYVLGRKAA